MTRTALLLCCLCAAFAPAAESVLEVPRADGRTTPLRVYHPAAGEGCAPLAVISHGAGGTEAGYHYLAVDLVAHGFRAIVMRHRESDRAALGVAMRAHGIRGGVEVLVADRVAEQARILDVGAALAFAESECHAPFKVLLGHSMGANTVMLEAGAREMIGVDARVLGQNRFDAYVALSPEGPGLVFPDHAWNAVHRPLLALSGTRDAALTGPPQTRQIAWTELPGAHGCQWQTVLDGATHMNFAGVGEGHAMVESEVTGVVQQFLVGVRSNRCVASPSNPAVSVK